jgi:Protein phosphatase 2C
MTTNPPAQPSHAPPSDQPVRAPQPAHSVLGSAITSRLLGFFGFAWQLPSSPVPRQPDQPPDTGAPDLAIEARQPRTLGAPILRSTGDDRLGRGGLTSQPRLIADGGSTGPLTVRAASVCGRRHAQRGETREDAYAIDRTDDGAVIMAVADGLGDPAARFATVGARVASMMAVQIIRDELGHGRPIAPLGVAAQVAGIMVKESRRFIPRPEEYTARTLATTLMAAWFRPDGHYSGFMVGDGAVFGIIAGQVSVVAAPRSKAYSATEALPGSYANVEQFTGQLVPGSALLLATDGLADPMQSPDVAEELGRSWKQPPTVLGFLVDMSFERKGEADDRTGACAWFASGNFDPAGAGA